MNMLTKMALGLIGQMRPDAPTGDSSPAVVLPPPQTQGGLPLMQALALRHSERSFDTAALPAQTLSDLLWAAAGINRPEHGGRSWQ